VFVYTEDRHSHICYIRWIGHPLYLDTKCKLLKSRNSNQQASVQSTWINQPSGRIPACHAGGRGSIPGQYICFFNVNTYIFQVINTINVLHSYTLHTDIHMHSNLPSTHEMMTSLKYAYGQNSIDCSASRAKSSGTYKTW
jgi:hypothetical protein